MTKLDETVQIKQVDSEQRQNLGSVNLFWFCIFKNYSYFLNNLPGLSVACGLK